MNSPTTEAAAEKPADPDIARQAVPGHGVPSQDPNLDAQVALDPDEAERESKSVLMGGGLVAGAAAGAVVGVAVAGPVGVLVGGTLGAAVGAVGGGAAGGLKKPADAIDDDGLQKKGPDPDFDVPPR